MPVHEYELTQPAEAGKALSTLASTIDDICRLVQGSAQGSLCCVLLRGEAELTLAAAPDLPAEALRLFEVCRGDGENGLAARWAQQLGFEGCITSPVLSAQDESLGIVALYYRGRPPYVARELLSSASRLVAAAIEHHKLSRFEDDHDSTTGLLSRRGFVTQLDALVRESGLAPLALLRIDLDRFQQINDALGFPAGDALLEAAGRRLTPLLDSGDLAARIGEDEFAVVLTKRAEEQSALAIARQLLETLCGAYCVNGKELFVTASIGVAMFPAHGDGSAYLLHAANLAMREAKRRGGNLVHVFAPDSYQRAISGLELEISLRRAIARRELDLMYQPVVSAHGRVQGFEALLSWRHPVRGVISPVEFIPIAEESGLIAEIGSWVIEQACLAGAGWRKEGCQETYISLNVSARQFERDDFVDTVSAALAASGFPADCLELELTESCVLQDLPGSAERMKRIRELGVSIAIDDFGTGYSSLSYLHKLPADSIKIDQSFLRGIAQVDGSLLVIQSIVRLAHDLHLSVVAEGVETQEELELVRLAGCDKIQGHLFGQPLRAEDVKEVLWRNLQVAAL